MYAFFLFFDWFFIAFHFEWTWRSDRLLDYGKIQWYKCTHKGLLSRMVYSVTLLSACILSILWLTLLSNRLQYVIFISIEIRIALSLRPVWKRDKERQIERELKKESYRVSNYVIVQNTRRDCNISDSME